MGWNILLLAFLLFNIFTFCLMAWDKGLAKSKERRIAENQFYRLALYGGSLGILAAMPVWKHKNRKWSFKRTIYAIGVGQLLLAIVLYTWFGKYLF